jgi:hypothetical protein
LAERRPDRSRYQDTPSKTAVSPCATCRHKDQEADGPYCTAFPQGIPRKILDGDNQHRQPVDGDHGIQYEAI